jgi:competence protein ComEC
VSDGWAVAMALAAAFGAWRGVAVPLFAALAGCAVAWWWRLPWLLCLAIGLLTSALAARSLAVPLLAPGRITAVATLVSDPESVFGAVRAEARVGHRRVELWARGAPGRALGRRLAGEQVLLTGSIVWVSPGDRERLVRRHLLARVTPDSIELAGRGPPWARAANRIRRTLTDGARSLPAAERALFTGFVIGDDRALPLTTRDEFRASGLSHLTAVSGENVAFVLAVAGPFLRRLGLRWRWIVTIVVLVFFAAVTRFEPSVLRAVAMAAIATTATFVARPASTLRVLALAVTALLIVDPLLVWSVGFGLSVGASLGIVLLARPLAARWPGPRILIEPLAITVAAQLGVLPVAAAVFGGVPLAAFPANLLAAPAAGPVMVWGLTGGLLAGLAPAWLATALHVPSRIGVGWIALVARRCAALPLGSIGWPVGAVLIVVAAALAACRARRAPIGSPM